MNQPQPVDGGVCGDPFEAAGFPWHCKLPKGHDGDHAGAQIHAVGVDGGEAMNPPTPSQDAEGGGNEACHYVALCLQPRRYHHSDGGDAVHHPFIPRGESESSIRADYEELVKAAEPFLTLPCYCEDYWLRDYNRHGPNCVANEYEDETAALRTALTRIEESLGGRKDD